VRRPDSATFPSSQTNTKYKLLGTAIHPALHPGWKLQCNPAIVCALAWTAFPPPTPFGPPNRLLRSASSNRGGGGNLPCANYVSVAAGEGMGEQVQLPSSACGGEPQGCTSAGLGELPPELGLSGGHGSQEAALLRGPHQAAAVPQGHVSALFRHGDLRGGCVGGWPAQSPYFENSSCLQVGGWVPLQWLEGGGVPAVCTTQNQSCMTVVYSSSKEKTRHRMTRGGEDLLEFSQGNSQNAV